MTWKDITTPDANGWRQVQCERCGIVGVSPHPHERIVCGRCDAFSIKGDHGLTDAEVAELFPDPTLIGNRISALTTALGIPPCDSCGRRKEWLNKAHSFLRGDHA